MVIGTSIGWVICDYRWRKRWREWEEDEAAAEEEAEFIAGTAGPSVEPWHRPADWWKKGTMYEKEGQDEEEEGQEA